MEKRVPERIGHVMRMSDERMRKAVVFGRIKKERSEKPVGREGRRCLLGRSS